VRRGAKQNQGLITIDLAENVFDLAENVFDLAENVSGFI